MTLCLAVLIFTIVAIFLIQAAEGLMQDVVSKIGSEGTETVEEVPEPTPPVEPETIPSAGEVPEQDATATFLLLGLDYQETNADAIFLVGLNATKKQAAVVLIPSNTVVPENGNKYKLGELYSSRGISFYKDFVNQETGIMADFYAAMPMSALSNLIDFLGGIQYQVPENMHYYDPTQNLKINLQAGSQMLTGDQVIQLLCYRGYSGKETAREDTHLNFVKSFCATFLVPANLPRASAIMNNMYYNCETDFEEADLKELGEMMFNFSTYSQTYTRVPGAKSGSFYAISTSRAKSMFEVYQ
jgi:LCP family protein required for cell wall assembly